MRRTSRLGRTKVFGTMQRRQGLSTPMRSIALSMSLSVALKTNIVNLLFT